jgi:hypothetical protein
MDWSITIAVVSLVLSIAVVLRENRSRKRDLFIQVYQSMLDPEEQEGRRLLFEAAEQGRDFADLPTDDRTKINHALSSANVLGFLYLRRHIPRDDVTTLMGTTMRRVHNAAESTGVYRVRDAQQGEPIWPEFRDFAVRM